MKLYAYRSTDRTQNPRNVIYSERELENVPGWHERVPELDFEREAEVVNEVKKAREFWILGEPTLGGQTDPKNVIHVREVLPIEEHPQDAAIRVMTEEATKEYELKIKEQVIEAVCEFLMNEAGNYCNCKNAYGEQCDKHAMTWAADFLEANKERILGK